MKRGADRGALGLSLTQILFYLCLVWVRAKVLIMTSQAQTPHPPFSPYWPCSSLLVIPYSAWSPFSRLHKAHFLTFLKSLLKYTFSKRPSSATHSVMVNIFPLSTPGLTFFLPGFFSLAQMSISWHCPECC